MKKTLILVVASLNGSVLSSCYGGTTNVCQDQNVKTISFRKIFNGQEITNNFGIGFSTFSGSEAYSDGAVIQAFGFVNATNIDHGDDDDIGLLPINTGDEKTYNISVDASGFLYEIENSLNQNTTHLPPANSYFEYNGWKDHSSGFQFNSGLFNFLITNFSNPSWTTDKSSTDNLQPVNIFPDPSPNGTLSINKIAYKKRWTGTLVYKVIENQHLTRIVSETYHLSDGTNEMDLFSETQRSLTCVDQNSDE